VIDRRILVNYRVAPDALAPLLPGPFRPKLAGGFGIAGICLIRLNRIRPTFLPAAVGVSSENAAHRIAVEWNDEQGQRREGVFIPRRDTGSILNALVGGRLFPGEHHRARFDVRETPDRLEVSLRSDDGLTRVAVRGRVVRELPATSVFGSLAEASAFFEPGSLGFSVTREPDRLDALELKCRRWHVEPLEVERVESSFFDDPAKFPPGTARFDCALLMRDIEHEWHGRPSMCCAPAAAGV
jgi:hypothetical protein